MTRRSPHAHTRTVLPTAWLDALDGLRPAEWPSADTAPLDLGEIVRAAEASVTVPLGWDALLSQERRESLDATAARWNRTPERVRQIRSRAGHQVRFHARKGDWRATLWAWAERPRAVAVPQEAEPGWPVLVSTARGPAHPELWTLQLAPGLWVLYRGVGVSALRSATLPAGRVLEPGEAAAALGLDEVLLAVAWPATAIWRTHDGAYAGHTAAWTSGEWLSALGDVLTRAGHGAWEEDLLFRAYRTLPDAPEVETATLKAALRRSRHLELTEVPRVWRVQSQPWAADDFQSQRSPCD